MQTFAANLQTYMDQTKFSRADIIEFSELTESEFSKLEQGKFIPDLMYRFFATLGLDYRTAYSNNGWEQRSIINQYLDQPELLRRMITNRLVRYLAKKLSGVQVLKDRLNKQMPGRALIVGRLLSGKSSFDIDTLSACKEAIIKDATMVESEFMQLLAKVMYSRIPNYNLRTAKEVFNLDYLKIAMLCKTPVSASGISNWGSYVCTSIPYDFACQLSAAFGIADERRFLTQTLKKDDFKYLNENANEVKNRKPTKKAIKKVELIEPENIFKEETKPEQEPDRHTQVVEHTSKVTNENDFNVEMIDKMFNKLTNKNKEMLREAITQVFVRQMLEA